VEVFTSAAHDPADASDAKEYGAIYNDLVKTVTDPDQVRICNAIRALYVAGMTGSSFSFKGSLEVFFGAHVILDDSLVFFDLWSKAPGVKERWSSHYEGGRPPPKNGTEPQYEIAFPKGWGALLFGKYQTSSDGGKTWTTHHKTWFQMEEYPAGGGAKEKIGHGLGWVTLKVKKKNSGPKGTSRHIETNQPVNVDCGSANLVLLKLLGKEED
jgi:hypothetical protein